MAKLLYPEAGLGVRGVHGMFFYLLPTRPPAAGDRDGRRVLEAGALLGAWGRIPKSVCEIVLEAFWLCKFTHSLISPLMRAY